MISFLVFVSAPPLLPVFARLGHIRIYLYVFHFMTSFRRTASCLPIQRCYCSTHHDPLHLLTSRFSALESRLSHRAVAVSLPISFVTHVVPNTTLLTQFSSAVYSRLRPRTDIVLVLDSLCLSGVWIHWSLDNAAFNPILSNNILVEYQVHNEFHISILLVMSLSEQVLSGFFSSISLFSQMVKLPPLIKLNPRLLRGLHPRHVRYICYCLSRFHCRELDFASLISRVFYPPLCSLLEI